MKKNITDEKFNREKVSHRLRIFEVTGQYIIPLIALLIAFLLNKNCGKQDDNLNKKINNSTTHKYVGDEEQIGERFWAVQNLDVDTFNDGSPIKRVTTREDWRKCNMDSIGCYCDFGTGKIYNFYVANDTKHGGALPESFQLIEIGDLHNIRNQKIYAQDVKARSGWKERSNGISGNGNNKYKLNITPTGYVTPEFELVGRDTIATSWMQNPSNIARDAKGNHTRWFFMHLQSDNDSINWDEQSIYYGYPIKFVRK